MRQTAVRYGGWALTRTNCFGEACSVRGRPSAECGARARPLRGPNRTRGRECAGETPERRWPTSRWAHPVLPASRDVSFRLPSHRMNYLLPRARSFALPPCLELSACAPGDLSLAVPRCTLEFRSLARRRISAGQHVAGVGTCGSFFQWPRFSIWMTSPQSG